MNHIVLAYEGRGDMLKAIFGSSQKTGVIPASNPAAIRALVSGLGKKPKPKA